MDDPYEALGLARGAPDAAVRKAYMRLAFQNHPDRDPSSAAAARFHRAREAYEKIRRGRHARARPPAREVVAWARRAFADALAGGLQADGRTIETEVGGVRVRVRIGTAGR
jgi:molecular chaperone DnaJ